jgi:hypothetical protein
MNGKLIAKEVVMGDRLRLLDDCGPLYSWYISLERLAESCPLCKAYSTTLYVTSSPELLGQKDGGPLRDYTFRPDVFGSFNTPIRSTGQLLGVECFCRAMIRDLRGYKG